MPDVTDAASNTDMIRALARELGFDLCGIADVTGIRRDFDLEEAVKTAFPFAVSLVKRLNDAVIEDIPDHPTQLYFHHYRQANFFLDRGAFLLADRIQALGARALPIPASQVIDWEKQRGHLSHKHVALAAGLGWIGRNNLLVNETLGARTRLVTVLTDMPLVPDKPSAGSCGPCRACVEACPAAAIGEDAASFDHLACYEKLKAFRSAGYVSQFICGVCVKACRPGRSR